MGFLGRIGLRTAEHRAWAMYDWANSAFILTVVTTLFPIFFMDVAAAGLPESVATQRFSWTTSLALAVVALMAPFLGAVADFAGIKKKLLSVFLAIGATATALMFFIDPGDWLFAAALFGIANVGAQGSFVFYDSLLPHIARHDEMDRVSAAAYAVGYFGSSILLAVQFAAIVRPDLFGLPAGPGLPLETASLPVRLGFLSVSLWWVVFAIPLFLRVPEPAPRLEADERPGESVVKVALDRLLETFRELRTYRHAFLMLVAFLIYNDGIGTIIRMATIYGTELGIGRSALIGSILIVQLVGVPFAFLFGSLAGRIGVKPCILLGLAIYTGVAIYAYFIETALEFFGLAFVVGMVQGGTQALSRSLFASLIPRHKSAEFFGLYGVLDKFAGTLGPTVFASTIAVTGSSRQAILSIIVFFVVGALLLTRVDVEAGRSVARRAESGLRGSG
ncbi:MAG: MFS transporter [Gemmatimonadota bacterium]